MASTLEILKHLLKYSPRTMPITGKLYGGVLKLNLKAEMEACRNNWFKGKSISKRLSKDQKLAFEVKLPYWKAYIKSLKKLRVCRSKAKVKASQGYDASVFTSTHEKFKDRMSAKFSKTVLRVGKSSIGRAVLVLDDFNKDKKTLRSLSHLTLLGIESCEIYIPNPGEKPYRAALKSGANSEQLLCEKALKEPWRGIRFDAAYLDFCTGSASYANRLIDLVMANAKPRFSLAVTLTGRDTNGDNMLERITSIDSSCQACGLSLASPCLSESVFQFKPSSVVTVFYNRNL